jgi:hypothetical protein
VGPARQWEREGMARGAAGLRETGRGAAHAEEKREELGLGGFGPGKEKEGERARG